MTVPSFRRARPPALRTRKEGRKQERFRGSARLRGYDKAWEKVREGYFLQHPQCEECLRRGHAVMADVVDHMQPIEDAPSRRLDVANLDSLCHDHHNGWKRRIETYARSLGMIEMLPTWIKQPDMRPAGFQITRTGPVRGDGTLEG